jgi:alpha-ribazole phosphatase/probable phosphoglycerate mutase
MKATRLYLVRHGQVAGFEKKRYNGQSNVPLTEVGRTQTDRLCGILAGYPLHAIYTSDLERCAYAAGQLARQVGLQATPDSALREMHCGLWEGRVWADLQQDFPEEWQARLKDVVHYRLPGGESFYDAALRVRPVVREILLRHAGQNVVLFSHGGINRIILLDAIGAQLDCAFTIEQDYACLNIVDYYPDGACRVRLMNGTGFFGTAS